MFKPEAPVLKERVQFTLHPVGEDLTQDEELPFKILVLGDFSGHDADSPLEDRQPIAARRETLSGILHAQQVTLSTLVPNKILPETTERLPVRLHFNSMEDFSPDALVRQVPELHHLLELRNALSLLKGGIPDTAAFHARLIHVMQDTSIRKRLLDELGAVMNSHGTMPEVPLTTGFTTAHPEKSLLDEILIASGYGVNNAGARHGLTLLLKEILTRDFNTLIQAFPDFSEGVLDNSIAHIDQILSDQLNTILHDSAYQQLEASWRSLDFLLQRVDSQQNVQVHILSVSKDELLADFEDAPEIVKSGLYKHAYVSEFGQFGGKPYGCLIGNYRFGPNPQDMQLLQKVAAVACMSHAPFLAAADKSFFGISEWEALPALKDLHSVFEMPQYARWHSFRKLDDARYVGLTVPGFLLRSPFNPATNPVKLFTFTEEMRSNIDFCWGSAAFAMGACMADSFAKYRWCVNIVGLEGGGSIANLPVYHFEAMGRLQSKTPVQVLISERREYELAEEGFMALIMRSGTDKAAFYSANSAQAAKKYENTPAGRESEINFKLSTQLPYMMIMNRLAHYIKVIQRENIGSWKERQDLETELNKWISQYVTEMDNPDATTRSKRPLRLARVAVQEVAGNAGWYTLTMLARPHFKYMGVNFTLALVGKLDKE